jgi:DNA-binding transcriptional LysR family regulator
MPPNRSFEPTSLDKEFVANEYLADGRLQVLLKKWSLSQGGLYFVTPTARARPAKISVLADFFADNLSNPKWKMLK